MDPVSIVKLEDVNGQPTVKVGYLPTSLRIGDPIGLRFKISRYNGGRTEVLTVDSQFRVTAIGLDAATLPRRQLLSVESMTTPPKWRSVKNEHRERPLAPAVYPRKVVE